MKKLAIFGSVSALTALVSANASAVAVSAVDVGVTDQLAQIPTDLTTVGVAILAAAALAVSFKWVKGMLFG